MEDSRPNPHGGPAPDLGPFARLPTGLLAVVAPGGALRWLGPGGHAGDAARDLADLLHPDDVPTVRAALTGDGPAHDGLLARVRTRGGRVRWHELHATRADGLWYLSARDVHDRERERDAHERSERLYRDLVDGRPEMIVRVDRRNRFLFVNEAYCRTFGKTRDELLGASFAPLVHEEDLPATLEAMERLASPPYRCTLVQRAWTKEGWRWIEWDDRAVVDERGAVIEVQGVGRDVTERHERERTLRSERRALEETASLARVGRWEYDHAADRLVWSPTVYELFDVDPEAFAPSLEAFLARVHDDDREFVRRAYRHAVEARRPYDIEHRVVTSSGAVVWLRELCEVEYDQAGRAVRSVGVVQDVSYRKLHDALTGLPNGLQLRHRLEELEEEARDRGDCLAVCSLDLDGFAELNAALGRGGADRVLIEVADRLRHAARGHDVVARTGGDEFALVLTGLSGADEALERAQRIASVLGPPVVVADDEVRVTACLGLTTFPHDDVTADTLRRHADQAMQAAKGAGRGRVVAFDPESERRARQRRVRVERLRLALDADEFEVFVQPTIHLASGANCGVEALIRWRHPEEGLLPPGRFLDDVLGGPIEIAMGRRVLGRALDLWAEWSGGGVAFGPAATVSVNVGAHQLLAPGFVDDVRTALSRHPGLSPRRLQLEVLESAALADLQRARDVLARCRALGVQIALDDFGTGYSSLSYIRSLPIDTLKIDRAFVQGMLSDDGDRGIVETVLGLATAFDRQLVAEGVETPAHAAALLDLGAVDAMAQGYAIARPMPASDYVAWAARWEAERPMAWRGTEREAGRRGD